LSKFVLDCSVAVAWHFEDEPEPYADRVLDALKVQRAYVPVLFFYEVANALLVAERKGRTTASKADAFFSEFATLPLEIDSELPLVSGPRTMALARNHHLAAYDATYLELAKRYGLPLATLDQALRKAAPEAGVSILFES
jgi:predicted nucleic acid-binding protein